MRVMALIGCAAMLTLGTAAGGQPENGDESVPAATVEPEATDALKRMSTYLGTLKTFELTSESTLDVVTVHEQRVQIDGVTEYKVAKPGIWINLDTDLKQRQYFYDGKEFTIYAPKLGFYASMPAPPTNREFLKAIYDRFGISLPLEDLFRWADGDHSDLDALTSGFNVGTAKIDGVPTDHWAFRQGDYDWEVWIEQGDRPLPRKLVIIDRTDPAMPGYTARLKWVLNPAIPASAFKFVPDSDNMRIQIATFTEEKE